MLDGSSVGKVYTEKGKVVLVFGVAEREGYGITLMDGIGINLSSMQVDEVSKNASEVHFWRDLDGQQLINLGNYLSIYKAMSENALVAISGKARTGKDTLADRIKKGHTSKTFHQRSLGDPIKDIHKVIYGETIGKQRDELILIGQGLRDEDPNVWIKTWLRRAISLFDLYDNVGLIVSDVRQPNDFSFFKSLGALTVSITAPEELRREILVKEDGVKALDEKLLNDETESYVFETDISLVNNYNSTFEEEMEKVLDLLT